MNAEVANYIAALKKEDRESRYFAAYALGEAGDASATPALLQTLSDVDWGVRAAATSALGKLKDTSAVPALIAALQDKDGRVRSFAASALGKIGDNSAVAALTEALRSDNDKVRAKAAAALGEIGDVSSAPGLTEALADANKKVRSSASVALVKIGAEAAPALGMALMNKNRLVRDSAADALNRVGDPATLPRKVLASSELSPQKKVEILRALRRVRYKDSYWLFTYGIPDTRSLCNLVLQEEDAVARVGAQQVLDWLNGNNTLLRAVEVNPADTHGLLVAYEGRTPEAHPTTLLRAVEEVQPTTASPPAERGSFWQRWFRGTNANG